MPIINKNGLAENSELIAILANDINPEEAFAQFNNADSLGIEFPSYADGRGSSIAKRLRRLGFAGKLRAIGPLIPDQFGDLIACGFDEVEISEEQLVRQPVEQWLNALKQQNFAYQNENGERISIIAKRWS